MCKGQLGNSPPEFSPKPGSLSFPSSPQSPILRLVEMSFLPPFPSCLIEKDGGVGLGVGKFFLGYLTFSYSLSKDLSRETASVFRLSFQTLPFPQDFGGQIARIEKVLVFGRELNC